jgi:hypothetical protein
VSTWVFLSSMIDEKYDIMSIICNNMYDVNKVATDFEKFWKIAQKLKSGKYFTLKESEYNKKAIKISVVYFIGWQLNFIVYSLM